MIPGFNLYFYPFLRTLEDKGCCRLIDISQSIALWFKLSENDLKELTRGGKTTKHISRINYCASYLKKMGLIENQSYGAYTITENGKKELKKYGEQLSRNTLRHLPEYRATQLSCNNIEKVYIKPHKKGDKLIGGYVCSKKVVSKSNPNVESEIDDN